ncbi:MAG: DUF669 domain-containing protein [Lachnospiraceae bacterium]|nr:DUF669 domain-containing protein [Lachnospiraceae bacterium]
MELEREFGWDDTIENDSEFVLLPEGEYPFEVTSFERARHNGSEKLPPCNKAVLAIKITAPDGKSTTINHNLFLHSKTEGMLCAFFTSIGQRKKGEKISMNWNLVPGSRGRCKVGIHTYKNKDGDERQTNQIVRFLEPSYGDSAAAPTFKAGEF